MEQIGIVGFELFFLAGAMVLMTINSYYEEWLEENDTAQDDFDENDR